MSSRVERDPVAIIGAACRLPGAPDVDAFWELLAEGRDAIGEIPRERFDIDHWYDPVPRTAGRIVTRSGGFIGEVDKFDPAFFGISRSEAALIDVQQRLLLESTWEALEDAGQTAEGLAGSRTSVYAGCSAGTYWDLLRRNGQYDLHAIAASNSGGAGAGRIGYHLDLRGPAIGIEATCATSLLAVHLACQGLWSGDADMAIVTSSNLLLTPDLYLSLSEAGMLSPTGKCRFGDTSADGYVRSEAVVSVILKPVSRAVADGDKIYATILGSATTSDGKSGGTWQMPGLEGQEAMLRGAYRDAGVSPAEVDYLEAHGPGTPAGDKVELTALSRVLGTGREPGRRRCRVGSVKSNVGHSEITAGLVGLLKAALVLRNRTIPPTLHVQEQHAAFDAPGSPLELATRATRWEEDERDPKPMIVGVNSFGLSGVNAHAVLTEAPRLPAPARVPVPVPLRARVAPVPVPRTAPASAPLGTRRRSDHLLPLSARQAGALDTLAGRYADLLDTGGEAGDPLNVCFSAGARRTHHEHRVAVVASGGRELAGALRSVAAGTPGDGVLRRHRNAGAGRPRVVFVFPGQGAQWTGMARELLEESPAFASRMAECDRAVREEFGWSVIERLLGDEPLERVDEVQPVLWAVQVALAAQWRHWGIEPDLVLGHSMGEVAAATVCGALTVRQAASVICRRSALLNGTGVGGAMWAVQLGPDAARRAIGARGDKVCVGVINSASSTVLSGDRHALTAVVEELRAQGVYCRQVRVDYASHAPQVEPLRPALLDALDGLRPAPGRVSLHSTTLDRVADGTELGAEYWMRNLRLPVRFASAARALIEDGRDTVFIEISPHPTLLWAIEDIAESCGTEVAAIGSLSRGEPETRSMLTGLGLAYVHGCAPRWDRVNEGGGFVDLPHYPWQRERFWVTPPEEPDHGLQLVERAADAEPIQVQVADDLAGLLRDQAAEILGVAPGDLEPDVPLTVHGLDSLLALRLRKRLERDLDILVPARELLGAASLAELTQRIESRMQGEVAMAGGRH
ncbi:acyltransferase domain-containing protein [Actinomadura barringtoniae]|uniref:Acyltransferase domain-containing protein n=1 Tax=Actinomadura barringtoniae TaxID=1427535 RepID=A0A939P9R6_9ACTN|nr:type I polyketide synthase [Actinomadura barringtoniae]MBO2448767.1 acyltransferase domain-containing protein [Actinomadura barringtoniae]